MYKHLFFLKCSVEIDVDTFKKTIKDKVFLKEKNKRL